MRAVPPLIAIALLVAAVLAPPAAAKRAQPAQAPDGRVVVGLDGAYADWQPTEVEERIRLGATVTRHEFRPENAVESYDRFMLTATRTVGTRIHALLGANELPPPRVYRHWVVAFVRRYGRRGTFWAEHPDLDARRYAIRTFELGNEPYFGHMTADEYAATVRPALRAVRRRRLPARMLVVSRVYGEDTSWIDTLYRRIPRLNRLVAGFADHPYWYGRDPATRAAAGPLGRIAVLRRRLDEHGARRKPIHITEYGQSTAGCAVECVSESDQARHVALLIDTAVARPEWRIGMVLVYQLKDRGRRSRDRELEFGILRRDGSEKPSYHVVKSRIRSHPAF